MKVMKRSLLASLVVVALLAMVVGLVYAFSIQDVDGVWGDIDGVTATSGLTTGLDVIGGYIETTGYPTQTDQTRVRNTGICGGDPDGDTTFAQWTSSTSATWGGIGSHNPGTCTSLTNGLFFSEYVYDNRSSAADYIGIEIYNGTGASVNLSNYSVLFFSGVRTFQTIALNSVNLAAGDVYVLVSSSATGQTTQEDQSFTGSDDYRAVVLVPEGTATEGARCNRWASGNGNTPSVISGWLTSVQNLILGDENQVRYGRDAFNPSDWNSHSCQITKFQDQSGFGFDGVNGPVTPTANVPFYIGTFTHYNQQVFSTNDSYQNANPFVSVPLTITVPVKCNDGSTPTPSTFSLVPTFTLDETSNSAGTCVYGQPGDVPCPDKVTVSVPDHANDFVCPDGTYTVVINGFTTEGLNEGEDCDESYNDDSVSYEFITKEDQDNYACLWASITAPTADIGPVKTCQVDSSGWISSFTIVTTNIGPGAAINPTMTDVLPTGVTYVSYTSTMTTTAGGTNPQGTCTYNSGTRTVSCNLLTPLPAPSVDANAKWTVKINVSGVQEVTNTATVSSITTDPNTSNNSSTATCSPTAVTLTSFTASEVDGKVVLDWETASEYNTLGYNLYMAASVDAEKVKVNDSLLPSNVAPGSLEGAVYTYTAGDASAGETYFWLEEVDISGGTTLYGPAALIITD